MNISLEEFRYYFGLEGNDGGLHSISLEFKPCFTEGLEPGDIKTEVRNFINRYMEVLDPLYEEFLEGDKKPTLGDFTSIVESGYRYVGSFGRKKPFAKDKRAAVEQYLRNTFGAESVDSHEDISSYKTQDVTLLCSFRKDASQLVDFSIKLDFKMSHVFNVCFFWFTRNLQGIEIGESARIALNSLEQTLKATSRRDNMDYYEALTLTGELEQGSQ
ncbi:MAG: hypothetical protein OXC05_11880 [Halieaceae bacterium]|nr:hypothetical protein [Halieaceae bacterium]